MPCIRFFRNGVSNNINTPAIIGIAVSNIKNADNPCSSLIESMALAV